MTAITQEGGPDYQILCHLIVISFDLWRGRERDRGRERERGANLIHIRVNSHLLPK